MELWKRDLSRVLVGVVLGMAAALAYFWTEIHP
jgi:hypothetical protein